MYCEECKETIGDREQDIHQKYVKMKITPLGNSQEKRMEKNKELYEILTELVEILADVIYEQATRDHSGTNWYKDKMDYVKLLREKIETFK